MSRTIKFRAWDKNDNKMYLVDKLTALEWIGWIQKVEGKGAYELMQFTELLDKNGKEIYEGDLIRWGGVIKPYVVIFYDGGFQIELTGYSSTALMQRMEVEVIGNIYENSELLKTK